jgi:diguanylate cyclase (GGDEF)-like protein
MEEEMRALATYDTLTGLLNRGEFLKQVEDYHKLEKNEEFEFSLVIMDIDNFKKINDQYGHISGDLVLESFANAVRTSIRDSDLASRFGGDEFVFFLPNTSADQAGMFAERLHSKIRTPVEVDGLQIRYTASMGLATCPDVFTINIDYVIGMADKALYHAKNMGGNQTQVFNANPNIIDWDTETKEINIFMKLSEFDIPTSRFSSS